MKELLQGAYGAWSALGGVRSARRRYKRYTYGDQWSDYIPDSNGIMRREEEIITMSGKRPMTNNLIRQLVKSVVGRYRSVTTEDGTYTRGRAADLSRANSLAELDSRLLEEFLISGTAVQRLADETRFGVRDVWVDNVDFNRFFVNDFRDPRGWDITMVGMLHDMPFPEVARRFGASSRARAEALRALFADVSRGGAFAPETVGLPGADIDFFTPVRHGYCRVVEIWTLDSSLGAPGGSKLDVTFRWHCRWLAPDGTLLGEYDSPWRHGQHPFMVKFYPLTDGEVHPFVEDVIDQQRAINRLIVLIDRILATSAKGVLLFPTSQLAPGTSWQDVVNRWAQADGVIPITGRGEMPQQVMTNPSASGAYQFLELQMKLFDDISGVGDALLGRKDTSARGVEMLETRLRTATIALADIFDTFTTFTAMRTAKALDMKQFAK
ncbi:MAG: hypothetical protein K2M55_01335 [Muribaculaceae bacterium]|nr:hypothetical protein [Muribaculaceae bacterium]